MHKSSPYSPFVKAFLSIFIAYVVITIGAMLFLHYQTIKADRATEDFKKASYSLEVSLDNNTMQLSKITQPEIPKNAELIDKPILRTNNNESPQWKAQVYSPIIPNVSGYLNAEVGAYSMYRGTAHDCYNNACVTASGSTIYVGAAACPASIPFGHSVSIFGDTYVCLDRVGEGDNADFLIFTGFNKNAAIEAKAYGIKRANVTVLN